MRRMAAVLVASALSFGVLTAGAAPAHACVDLRCQIACIKAILSGGPCPD